MTITLDDGLLADIDKLIDSRGYQNRSEAIRDLARSGLQQAAVDIRQDQPSVAALVYTYDHTRRNLSKRLTDSFHQHSAMAISTLHVHLDDVRCLEVTILKGASDAIRHFADHVIAERGLQHGQLVVLPVESTPPTHSHRHETGSDAA